MSTRYGKWPFIQPVRKINHSLTDIYHTLKLGENIDELANKYYKDPTLGWIIMCANSDYGMEFMIPIGTSLRIPFPLTRVWDQLGAIGEV